MSGQAEAGQAPSLQEFFAMPSGAERPADIVRMMAMVTTMMMVSSCEAIHGKGSKMMTHDGRQRPREGECRPNQVN